VENFNFRFLQRWDVTPCSSVEGQNLSKQLYIFILDFIISLYGDSEFTAYAKFVVHFAIFIVMVFITVD